MWDELGNLRWIRLWNVDDMARMRERDRDNERERERERERVRDRGAGYSCGHCAPLFMLTRLPLKPVATASIRDNE